MKYLLDTNICIYLIKNKPIELVRKFEKVGEGKLAISSVTLAELEYGVEKSLYKVQNRMALNAFLAPIDVLEFGGRQALIYGRIRAELERGGRVIGGLNVMIAAQALADGLVLITNNEREFVRVEGLRVENWVSGV